MKRGVALLTPPDRIVKPRKPVEIRMPIVVCDENLNAYYEHDEKMRPWVFAELVEKLRRDWPVGPSKRKRSLPIMLVCANPHKMFVEAHKHYKKRTDWQVRLSVTELDPDAKVSALDNLHIRLFGFRDSNRQTRYFHPIAPQDFFRDFTKEYGDSDHPEWLRLYQWGADVRNWIRRNKLRFSTTKAGLAAQLLRDDRFYPRARRKIPKLTNEKARNALPGNFYAMTTNRNEVFGSVYVIDQTNAHHYAAETVLLPDANTLEAKGRYRSLSDEVWLTPKRESYSEMMAQHGLVRMRAYIPKGLLGVLPPWAERGGLQSFFVYTNEIPLIHELGLEVRHISYGWLSPKTDSGLSQYAAWAQTEIEANPNRKAWLKPCLLSAYGILGVKPRRLESAFWASDKGKKQAYFFGGQPEYFQQVRGKTHMQSAIANTIHRGMIEAETRKLSVAMGRYLESFGENVIAIHADAVIVEDRGQQLPLLPEPWRIKHKLSRFQVIDKVSFESQSHNILPGRRKTNV